jgi:hypothetical protein
MQRSVASPENLTVRLSAFARKLRVVWVSMVVLLLMAGAIRLYRLHAPGVLIDCDFASAILARSFYFEHTGSVEEWRKEVARTTRQRQPILEPPVTEFLVSVVYRAVNGEHLWVARLLTSSFWLIGGVFLFRIAERIVSTGAAVFATAYYLFNPLSITLSRSFQPDSLMMMLFLISLFCIIRYYEVPSDLRLVAAALVSGLTLLYRPLVLFPLLGAFTALALNQGGGWKRFIDKRFLIFTIISLAPPSLYYGYGTFVGFFRWKLETSFQPYLLLRREFWMGWLYCVGWAVGYAAPIGALLGASMLRKGLPRALLMGLMIGYVAFGLVFTQHIHTHGYYQGVLIPIIALSLGPLVTLIANRFWQTSRRGSSWLTLAGMLVLALSFGFLEVRSRLGSQVFESVETTKEIGRIVEHSSRVVYVARYYGLPLQYYGELTGAYWPRRITYYLDRRGEPELSIEQRLDALDFSPEYFVITDFSEFSSNHTDLKAYLADRCVLVAGSEQYLIYNACAQG